MAASHEEDSLSLLIEPPAPQQSKLAILKDCEIRSQVDNDRISLYLAINGVYMSNLMSRKQRANVSNILRNKLGINCILFKEFTIETKEARHFTGEDEPLKGNVHILFNPQLNLQFKVYFNKKIKKNEDFIWMYFNFSNCGVWKSKSYSFEEDGSGLTFCCKIPTDEFNDFMEPNVLMTVTIKKKQTSNTHQLGIINLGNTCFMNSCLQMLFYIKPFRKIILETKSDNKVIKELKNVFIMLMDTEEKKPVDIENLLEAYGKYNEIPRQQQDVQEFLLDFINEVQQQCPEVKSLWEGKCSQTTYSVQPEKHYKSVQEEEFAQLDVHLFDRKQNPYRKIEQSLQDTMQEQQVEDMIDHDEYGKIKIAKYRTFLTLPDILFVNLKRYEWNKQKMRLSKIFSHIDYGENLNLGFIVGTPGNEQVNPDCDYTLFSVIVHKGTCPQNGHYFVFVNTSTDCDKPEWICFNDSLVTQSDPEEVLGFTGKKAKETILDKNAGRFVQRQIQSNSSSYLLVYIRKAVFNEYQSIKTRIPKQYLNEKIQKQTQKQKQSLQDVNIYILDNSDEPVNLFNDGIDFMTVPLPKNGELAVQLKKVTKQLMMAQAKYFYRVYVSERKVKFIEDYECVSDLTKFRRGFESPTYILALSQKVKQLGDKNRRNAIGVVKVSKNELDEFTVPQLFLATPHDLNNLQEMIVEKNGKMVCVDSRQDFDDFWNRYIEVEIYKINELD